MTRSAALADTHGRVMRDLRVSITDRGNFLKGSVLDIDT